MKYPAWMKLEFVDGELRGTYVDQYDRSCEFELVAVVNAGRELLLNHCGQTKGADAFAPIHRVKLVDGELHATVVTDKALFKWVARKVRPEKKPPPKALGRANEEDGTESDLEETGNGVE